MSYLVLIFCKGRTDYHARRNDAAIEKSQELSSLHNVKSAAYKVDGKYSMIWNVKVPFIHPF